MKFPTLRAVNQEETLGVGGGGVTGHVAHFPGGFMAE